MLNVDPERFAVLLAISAIGTCLAFAITSNITQRVMLILLLLGFFLYSGLATTDQNVGQQYIFYHTIFMLCIIAGFVLGLSLFHTLGRTVGEFAGPQLSALSTGRFPAYFLIFYVSLHLMKLIVPEFRLHLLIDPPVPNIRLWFSGRLEDAQSQDFSPLHYLTTLSVPFFYLALYQFRKRIFTILAIVLSITYIRYVDQSYIGRSELFFSATFIFLVLWMEYRTLRWALVIAAVCVTPTFVTGFYAYSLMRLGVDFSNIDLTDAVAKVLDSEFTFLIRSGIPLIDSAQHADLGRYLTWILTLPVPGFLKGSLDVARVNYDMSAIVLGRGVGDPGFYVLLPGLLAESIYLFGETLFFVHALFVGIAAAFFCRLCERVPALSTLFVYVAILFFYNLSRGGIASLLPSVINEFIVFYVFIGISIYRGKASLWRSKTPRYSTDGV